MTGYFIKLSNGKIEKINNITFIENDYKFDKDIINIYFENNEVSKVIFINQLNGKMSPLGQTKNEELKIKGFKWLEDLRPKNKYEILSPKN